ncbi:MAG: DUF6191 domain-containing protein [Actinocrinis sp.]
MSIFFDLFNPNNRNRTEELRRLENTREEEGQGAPGRGPIDLNSGTVFIRVPTNDGAASEDADDADDDTAEGGEPEAAEGAAALGEEDSGA